MKRTKTDDHSSNDSLSLLPAVRLLTPVITFYFFNVATSIFYFLIICLLSSTFISLCIYDLFI